MSESFWLGLIQFLVSPIILLVLGARFNRRLNETEAGIKETKKEITNSHKTHLRDDLDSKFNLVFARQDTIVDELKRIDKKLDSHRSDLNELYSTAADHERRLTGQAAKIRRSVAK